MAIYKVKKCGCGYKGNEPEPKEACPCPRCGSTMSYSDNWYISYTINGVKRVEAVAPQKRMAEDRLAKVRVEIREGKFFDKAPVTTWNKAVDNFRVWMRTNVTPNTRNMYESNLKILGKHFGRYTLNQITPQMVEQFKSIRRDDGKKNATINRAISTIKRLFAISTEHGLVDVNRLAGVKMLKENNARTKFLSRDEISRLLAACSDNEWLVMAVKLALHTGLRKDGIITMEWTDIDFKRRVITRTVKGGKKLPIPMTETITRDLMAYRQRQTIPSRFLFPSPVLQNRAIHHNFHTFERACQRAGIHDFHFHDLRHTFASHFLMQTGDLKALQEILGHSDLKMTMRYSHLLDEHKRDAMRQFDRFQVTG